MQSRRKTTGKNVVALVGAGAGGLALLEMLLEIPVAEISCVCDINRNAPGMVLARASGIYTCMDVNDPAIAGNADLDLILEVTGRDEVFERLSQVKAPETSLIGARANEVVFSLLNTQNQMKEEIARRKDVLEEQVALRTGELQDANRQLEQRIAEWELLNAKLQQINNEKTRYLLQSTHQLKAPFAAIQSYTDVLLDGYAGPLPEKAIHAVTKIKARCDRLSNAIKNMLKLANLKSCVAENIRFKPEHINAVIGEAIDEFAVLAGKRNITIHYESVPGADVVVCNREQIGMLLGILIENAIDYSTDGAVVSVGVREEGGRFRIAVEDRGIGIAPEHRERIFDVFFRTNEAVAQNSEGSGMGLAIAQEVATLHKTRVEVQSEQGRGSSFSFALARA